MQTRREERFKRTDANGDGKLTREEARKGMPGVARHFDQLDANKDGVVTRGELDAARKARAGTRRGPDGSLRPGAIIPASRENLSSGTGHGTARIHFLPGGRVRGGLYGPPPV